MLLNIVNGYVCHNCTDVENAKKGVDPAHPKKDAAQQPTKTGLSQNNPAVILSGALAKASAPNTNPATSADIPIPASANPSKTGAALNVTV